MDVAESGDSAIMAMQRNAATNGTEGQVQQVLDSGTHVHIGTRESSQHRSSIGPLELTATTASGDVVRASAKITNSINFGDGQGEHLLQYHVLEGNKTWLLSMCKLTAVGFRFYLSDFEPSVMWTSTGSRIMLERQHPSTNSGYWLVSVNFAERPGQGRILNRVEIGSHDDRLFFGRRGEELIELPHFARVQSGADGAGSSIISNASTHALIPSSVTAPSLTDLLSVESRGPEVRWRGRSTETYVIEDDGEARSVFAVVSARKHAHRSTGTSMSDGGVPWWDAPNGHPDQLSQRGASSERASLQGSGTTVTELDRQEVVSRRKERRAAAKSAKRVGRWGRLVRLAVLAEGSYGTKALQRTDTLGEIGSSATRPAAEDDSSIEGSLEDPDHSREPRQVRAPAQSHKRGREDIGKLGRPHYTEGEALHAALGHPHKKRFERWQRCADGFPRRIPHQANCRCWACIAGKLRRKAIAHRKALGATVAPRGAKWSFDLSRTWAPDIFGVTGYVLFVEESSGFVVVYPMRTHSEFFDIARQHIDFVRRRFKVEVHDLHADYDPIWSSTYTRDFDPATAECREFERETRVSIHRSAPYTQARNPAEPFMGIIMGTANQLMIYAHLAPDKFWWTAVLHAVTCHNYGPVESATRPLLRGDTTPFEVLSGRKADITMLSAAPFGALCWYKVFGRKASQFSPMAKPGILLGLARGTVGWSILPLSEVGNGTPKTVITYHMQPMPDMSRRPAILARHDAMLAESPLSSGPKAFNQAIRDLFRNNSDPAGTLIVFDELTGQPVGLERMYDPTVDDDVLVESTEGEIGVSDATTDARTAAGGTGPTGTDVPAFGADAAAHADAGPIKAAAETGVSDEDTRVATEPGKGPLDAENDI